MRSPASREAKREYHKRYYVKNRESIIARTSAWAKANPERHREYQRKTCRKYREKRAERNRAFAAVPENAVKKTAGNAARRGIEWTLPDGLAIDLITDNCFYCGGEPAPLNGIDRVDNARGYVDDNVVTACKYCNTAKLTRSRVDFEAWAVRVARHVGAGVFYPFT